MANETPIQLNTAVDYREEITMASNRVEYYKRVKCSKYDPQDPDRFDRVRTRYDITPNDYREYLLGDDFLREVYNSGQCHALALALHLTTGYPIMGATNGSKNEPAHFAVRCPDGLLMDSRGKGDINADYYGDECDQRTFGWSEYSVPEVMRISLKRSYLCPNIPEALKMAIVVLQRVAAEEASIKMAEQQFGQEIKRLPWQPPD